MDRNHHSAINELTNLLGSLFPLTETQISELKVVCSVVNFKAGEPLLVRGDSAKCIYYVIKGAQRGVLLSGEKESTLFLSFEGSLCTNVESIITGSPATYGIECISDSTLLKIPRSFFYDSRFEEDNIKLREAIFSNILVQMNRRIEELLGLTAEERFKVFLSRSGSVLNKIPHKYIASFLGMSKYTFSRLLNSHRL